ncbi:hypothetical protein PR048_023283 [Dryococelus australis]|uniref:Uncharacterized protein n=1 Tax=Dryococelus australis TaxID=614101 RepID=A0ABQ9GTR3_9NEOP|nr:hypothetical protein PR048_023283 [Dryococelus australis]
MIASGNNAKTDSVKIALLLNIMGQKEVDLYNTLDFTRYKLLKNTPHPKKFKLMRERFSTSKIWLKVSPLTNTSLILKKLVGTCEFRDLEDSLIWDRIIVGIHSTSLRESVLRLEELTWKTSNISLPDKRKK